MNNFIVIDTESTGLHSWLGDEAFCVGIFDGSEYWYWEWPVDLHTRKVKYKYDEDFFELQRILFETPDIEKGFWNRKHDQRMLENIFNGRKIVGKLHEIMFMAKCCNSMEPSYKLKDIGEKYLDIPRTDETNLKTQVQSYRKVAKKKGYNIGAKLQMDYWLPVNMGAKQNLNKKYNLLDCKRTYEAYKFFYQGMKELKVQHTYEKEMELFPIVYEMEQRGVRYDYKILKEEQTDIRNKEIEADTRTRNEFGVSRDFNFDSPKQLVELLFTKLNLPVQKQTEKGNYSTDVTTLKKLREYHPGVNSLLKKRAFGKGLDYLNIYEKFGIKDKIYGCALDADWVDIHTVKCIHPNLNQWGGDENGRTGRFTSNDPNLQNVTSEETSGGENVVDARHLFIPRNGYYWLVYDYKQLELRIFASRANEERMIDAFNSGRDIHDEVRRTVSILGNMPEKKGRKIAKNVNFTIVNGGGAKVLYEKYEVPLEEGKSVIKDYYKTYPDVRKYIDDMTKIGTNQGYIYNAYNRRLALEHGYEYRASSYDIQGSAADVIKNSMINCDKYLKEKDIDCHMLLTIHDELIFECHKSCCTKTLARDIRDIMQDHKGVFQLPLPVDFCMAEVNWRKKVPISL